MNQSIDLSKIDPALIAQAASLFKTEEQINRFKQSINKKLSTKKLDLYKPEAKHLEFFAAGLTHRERCFLAGNRLGKTMSCAYEIACHATGLYPEWWPGRRYNRGLKIWVVGVTALTVRDSLQDYLVGVGDEGVGFIPPDRIISKSKLAGLSNAVDTIEIRHESGQTSYIVCHAYSEGTAKMQSATLDIVWCDEEPDDEDLYIEILTRTLSREDGMSILSCTPLKGETGLVSRYYPQVKTPDVQKLIQMTLDDVTFLSAKHKEAMVATYPKHLRDAKTKGIPFLGSGAIFDVSQESIAVGPFPIPQHFHQIIGLDIGIQHATAACKLAIDRENDVIYLTHVYKVEDKPMYVHAEALRGMGGNVIPIAWPRDADQREKSSGISLSTMLKDDYNLSMINEYAQFADGGYQVEPGLQEIISRMATGRFKVFSTCVEFFKEMRSYHRKNGVIVKKFDDAIDACRYAVMMQDRYAEIPKTYRKFGGKLPPRNVMAGFS